MNQLELLGVPVLNGSWGIAASRNKMRILQLLATEGVPVPLTVMASNSSGLKEMVRFVGGPPVMVKLLSSNERSGVMIAIASSRSRPRSRRSWGWARTSSCSSTCTDAVPGTCA